MRRARGFVIGAVAVGALFASAAPASAATFCVDDAACESAGGMHATNLQNAFNLAQANGTNLDTVKIGATVLVNSASAPSGDPVEIVGAGIDKTGLSGPGQIVTAFDPASSIRDVAVHALPSSNFGVLVGGTAKNVTVDGTPSGAFTAFQVGAGTSSNLVADLPMANTTAGIVTSSPAAHVEDSKFTASIGATTSAGMTMSRVQVVAASRGVVFQGTQLSRIEDTTIRMTPTADIGLVASSGAFSSGLTAVSARHLTLIGGGATLGISAGAGCNLSGGGNSTTVALSDSIVRGFDNDAARSGGGACPTTGTAVADLSLAYSVFDPAKVLSTGLGTLSNGAGNRNVDPLLVDTAGGNLRPAAGSPVIDAGDPAAPTAGESATDLGGSPRITDGDGDGTARRDIGAYEAPAVPLQAGSITRTLKLSFSKRRHLFKGKVKSSEAACRSGRVVVFRKKGGPDDKVGAGKANAKGKWSLEVGNVDGKYYGSIAPTTVGAVVCPAAKSKPKKL